MSMAEHAGPDAGTDARSGIEARLGALRARHGDRVPLGAVGELVTGLLDELRAEPPLPQMRLHRELEALVAYIDRAKEEITAVRADDIAATHIPLASCELDAIGAHLEEATGVILDACEQLETVGRQVGSGPEAAIAEIVTRVYEACSFQDVTGQRITKLVRTLQTIEERIDRLLTLLGHELAQGRARDRAPAGEPAGSSSLLNGPQLPGAGNSQADIDALLASFG